MSDVKPALTAEEWEIHGNEKVVTEHWCEMVLRGRSTSWEERTHALAALCLHGQEFGFTREDVRMAECLSDSPVEIDRNNPHLRAWAKSLHDRIKALLPPEQP